VARKERSPESRIGLLEGEVERLTKAVRAVEGRLAVERERVRRLTGEVASQEKGERLLRSALRLGPRSKAGAKGRLGDLEETVVGLQEYLLRTSERIDKILTALKEHREFLGELDKRVVLTGTRERIRLELDVMKNTLSILALAGVEVDDALPRDIEKARTSSLKEEADLAELRRTKDAIDKRFDEELKRFDLEAIWSKKREIPGYR
jgi:chromosome segregation ATPase